MRIQYQLAHYAPTDISRRYVDLIWLVSVSMGCGSGFKNQMDPSDIGLETILMVRHPR